MQTDHHMRLSPWHMELAKCLASGMENKEVLTKFDVSPSRLSVIKSNPLFRRQVETYKKLEKDAYNKALEVLEEHATEVAQTLVDIIKSDVVNADVRVKASEGVLNRLAQKAGVGHSGQGGQELVFEQLLRVTKRTNGLTDSEEEELPYDGEAAYKELVEDMKKATPIESIEEAPIEMGVQPPPPQQPSPSNGDSKGWSISPRLMAALQGAQ